MKLHINNAGGRNLFTGYGADYIAVNGENHAHGLVLTPERIIEEGRDIAFSQLDAAYFEFLLTLTPEIVLFGSGPTLRFPPPALTRCLVQAGIGLEVMGTAAACRTYNILAAENRNVVAAILLK